MNSWKFCTYLQAEDSDAIVSAGTYIQKNYSKEVKIETITS